MNLKKVILPIDGSLSFFDVEQLLQKVFSIPGAKDVISHIKLNDVVYGDSGCLMMKKVIDWLAKNQLNDILIFLDSKIWSILLQGLPAGRLFACKIYDDTHIY